MIHTCPKVNATLGQILRVDIFLVWLSDLQMMLKMNSVLSFREQLMRWIDTQVQLHNNRFSEQLLPVGQCPTAFCQKAINRGSDPVTRWGEINVLAEKLFLQTSTAMLNCKVLPGCELRPAREGKLTKNMNNENSIFCCWSHSTVNPLVGASNSCSGKNLHLTTSYS